MVLFLTSDMSTSSDSKNINGMLLLPQIIGCTVGEQRNLLGEFNIADFRQNSPTLLSQLPHFLGILQACFGRRRRVAGSKIKLYKHHKSWNIGYL